MVDYITNTTTNATNRIGAGSTMLASNFETFLTLLTSQLKNQDPLSPVDSNQFTAQLTQMAGVEQQGVRCRSSCPGAPPYAFQPDP